MRYVATRLLPLPLFIALAVSASHSSNETATGTMRLAIDHPRDRQPQPDPPVRIDPLDNGALWYLRAMTYAPLDSDEQSEQFLEWFADPASQPDVRRGDVIGLTRMMVNNLERAQVCSVCVWPIYVAEDEHPLGVMFPYAGRFRPMIRLLHADAIRLLVESPDDAESVNQAARRVDVALRLAQDIAHVRHTVTTSLAAGMLEQTMPVATRALNSPLLSDELRDRLARTVARFDYDDPFLLRSSARIEYETNVVALRREYATEKDVARFNEEMAEPGEGMLPRRTYSNWPPQSKAELDEHFDDAERFYTALIEAMETEDWDRVGRIEQAYYDARYGPIIEMMPPMGLRAVELIRTTRQHLDRLETLVEKDGE